MAIEIEKKYRLTEQQRADVIESLKEFGAECLGRDDEENIIYGNQYMAEQSSVLRLRRIGDKTILTFKKRLPGLSDAKHQIEEETEVSDHDATAAIVENLGLEKRLVYEKRREKWRLRNTDVLIDELPFGLYLEIEGSITAIKEVEMLLDADLFESEPETYPRLTMRFGKRVESCVEARFDQTR